jgi:hypothetical protein
MGCVSRKRNKESSRWSCAIKEKVCPFPFMKRLCFYCRFIFQLVYSFNLFFLLRIYIYIYIYIDILLQKLLLACTQNNKLSAESALQHQQPASSIQSSTSAARIGISPSLCYSFLLFSFPMSVSL